MAKRAAGAAPTGSRAGASKSFRRSIAAKKEPLRPPLSSARPDALGAYNDKRNFAKTAEAKGQVQEAGGDRFCVQKHDATRLHYDLRLELDGVLKSWAVTRGPSLVPGEKRLSVHTEDHPMEYLTLEGVIPKGEYGGGTMIVMGRGTLAAGGRSAEGLRQGPPRFLARRATAERALAPRAHAAAPA